MIYTETKICSKCKRELPATTEFFRKHYSCKFGLYSKCKECEKEYRKNRKCISDEYFKKYYDTHKDIKKQHYSANRKHILYIKKLWRNKEEVKERESLRQKERYKVEKHRNIRLILNQKRRSLAKENSITVKEWECLKEKFNYCCAYCGEKTKLTQDHIVPLSKGGMYTKNNIVPACSRCNSSKNNKDLEEWYRNQEFFQEERLQSILKIQKEI